VHRSGDSDRGRGVRRRHKPAELADGGSEQRGIAHTLSAPHSLTLAHALSKRQRSRPADTRMVSFDGDEGFGLVG
jgi:hypothetical protein